MEERIQSETNDKAIRKCFFLIDFAFEEIGASFSELRNGWTGW